jgi:Trypsin-like serine proteases, typically periplasmic, contain C-terminal PDZ domain
MKRGKRFIISLIPVLVLAFLFQSCLTADEASIAPPEPSEAMAGNIEQLAANDPEASIAMLSDLFEKQREKGEPLENSIIGGKAVELFGKSASTMLGLFRKALQEEDIVTAKRLSFSAHTISRYASLYEPLKNVLPTDFSAMGEPAVRLQLIFLEAEAKFKKNGYVAGKAVLAAALSAEPSLLSIRGVPSAISKEIDSAQEPALFFSSWEERAKANNDIEAAAWFDAMAAQIKPEAVSPLGEKEDWIARAVSSVVTVYVDRGFKIQGGYSVPDRVLGTGFQIAPGLYLTNHHVVQSEVDPSYKGYSRLSIRPSDNPQARVPAKVIGWDEEMDLALLQSEEKLQSVIYIPSSMKFQAGDRVFAVGSPIGLENSVTAGVVSSLSRKIISYGEAAQIDVPVNQGNSGSPLFSANGLLVGMVFAGLPSFQNINFALPVQWIVSSLPALFSGTSVVHPRLGIVLGKGSGQNPVVLSDLDKVSRAFRAGDVLKEINGVPAKDIASIQLQLAAVPPDALCMVEAQRDFQPVRRLRRIQNTGGASLIPAWDTIKRTYILEGILGARLEQLEDSSKVGGLYSVSWVCPAEAADETGIAENDTININKIQLDRKNKVFILEFSAKSRLSGYFERTIRLELPAESAAII